MRVAKKFLLVLTILVTGLVIVACNGEVSELSSFTFSGLDNVEVEFDSEFNILDGVTATGDDEEDYTDKITFVTTSQAIAEDGTLNTTIPGDHLIRYEVKEGLIQLQEWRTITVKTPERTGDELIQNGDFSQGLAYWTGDQGSINLNVVDGVLEAEVVPGGNPHEPRLFQMGVPFEMGKTYKVSFDAKSSEEKTINLQVGELLDGPPYFTDFKPLQVENRTITTDWESYEYTFKHNLDNDRGGVLFEFGPVAGTSVEATVSLRNIKAEEIEEQPDTAAPILSGVTDKTFEVGATFDPMLGVTAHDLNDGDVTDDITFVILDAEENEVEEIDNEVAGVYTITYTVSDAAGNKAEETITVTFEEMTFVDHNLIVNGDFSEELGDTWSIWHADWDSTTASIAIEDNKLAINVADLGSAADWGIQVFQEGITVEKGKYYLLTVVLSAENDRDINFEFGETNPENADEFWPYADLVNGLELTSEPTTQTLLFQMSGETTNNAKLLFKLANTANPDTGKVFIHSATLQERYVAALIDSDFTNEKHVVEQASDETHATAVRTEDSLEITVTSVGAEAYVPHYFYELEGLDAGTYTYTIDVTGSVSRTLRFNIVVPNWGFASILPPVDPEDEASPRFIDLELVANELGQIEVTFVVAEPIVDTVKIELDFGPIVDGETNEGVFLLENITLVKE